MRTVNSRGVGSKNGRNKDVAPDQELPVDSEQFWFIRKLEPERPNGATSGR